MAQASAKKSKKQARLAGEQRAKTAQRAKAEPRAPELEHKIWRLMPWQWAGVAILAVAAFVRLFKLADIVMHHDEGVNGAFMTTLFRNGYYHYDPANYHGPSLYYAGLLLTSINSFFYGRAALSTFAIRLVTAIFGIGVVWLMLYLRRQLGTFGSLAAAALATASPGLVFFSRYFIHEILFVFFTLGVIVAWLKYRETSQPRYFILAAASAALMGTTKETWVITAGVWLIAVPCTTAWMKLRTKLFGAPETRPEKSPKKAKQEAPAPAPAAPEWSRGRLYATAAGVFMAIWVLLYSSFFTNPQGVVDSVRTFTFWFKTSEAANVYPWTRYFEWLGKSEAPVMLLGLLGIVVALWQSRSRFAVFTAFWSIGIFAAYCLIAYKTPWNALSIVAPWIVMAGYGLGQMYDRWSWKAFAVLLIVAAVAVAGYQAVDLSFFRYDDETEPYVYAHTKRDFLNLIHEVQYIAAGNPAGKNINITIMATEHWPMPWYLRDYSHAAYYGKVVPTTEPIIIAHQTQLADVERQFGDKYRLLSSHDLRPGNRLYLFLRKDLQP